ncbi:MAG: serine hydrolase [Pseudomonadota bacterium]
MNTTPQIPDAAASHPAAQQWMVGSPPPRDRQVRFAEGGLFTFPQLRWAFSNIRQLMPTVNVWRGHGPLRPLSRADREDIDAVEFLPLGGTQPMRWDASLAANYTDGIVVLHRGRIVYERYPGVLQAHGQHIGWSVTKSLVATLAASLAADGLLDTNAPVTQYVPELSVSGWGNATVRQVMDMTTALQFSEEYVNPAAEVWTHARAGGIVPRPAGYDGIDGFCAYLQTVKSTGEHGRGFTYRTINTDVLGWIVRRVTGLSLSEALSQRIWSQIGAEQDAYMTLDTEGTEFSGGGFNGTLRDMARFGEMMRNEGWFNGRQVVPTAAIDDIRMGGDRAHFASASYPLLPGWSYRNMWWVTHNAHGAFVARGIHGQNIYIDPLAEMVIARFASHPMAASMHTDPTTLPAYHALARYLISAP